MTKIRDQIKLHFLGGAKVVTGVCYLLETDKSRILVDCGLFQGEGELEKRNFAPFAFEPREIDAVIITHSHLDHVGRLPQLIAAGFEGKIFATPPTIDFTRLILEDSAKILTEKAERAGVVPLAGFGEISRVMEKFAAVDYYRKTEIAAGVNFTFHEAGHILGSASVALEIGGKKIVFSGDLGNPPVPLLRAPDFLTEADYVIVESTYGDRGHESAEDCREMIENAVEDAAARGGVLLIPSFAMERTQQLLYHLNNLVEHKRIPRMPIFIDSPLAIRITEIYKKYPQYYNREAIADIDSGDDVFRFPGLSFTETVRDSKNINEAPAPKIIIAGSGMSQGGRIIHHEVLYLNDPKNTLLLVTYQAAGTLGRKIADGVKRVEILDKEIEVAARVQKISGYSAHADQRFLMKWLGHFKKTCYGGDDDHRGLKKVFVTQGEPDASNVLARLVRDELGVEARVPDAGEIAELF